jgi:hypothetical protein
MSKWFTSVVKTIVRSIGHKLVLLPQNKLNVRPVQRRDLCKLRAHSNA